VALLTLAVALLTLAVALLTLAVTLLTLALAPAKCTGNIVVPSSSHKRKVAGLIPAGCMKTFLFPLPLLPHRLTSCFDVGRHLSFKEKSAQDIAATETTARPAHVEKKKVLPLQSSGEERKEDKYTVQLVACQYWYKL
jgi:hypothetical protein